MTRRITPRTTLDNLKKEAKRRLKALRAGDAEALARLQRSHPTAPAQPALRDVQHAIALEHGLAGWPALSQALEKRPASELSPDPGQVVDRFLEYACPDHHIRGRPAHRMARHAAMRILRQHPGIARHSIHTAVVCGDLEEVRRTLRQRPQAARERSSATAADRADIGGGDDIFKDIGPKGWEPLSYLCFTRLPLPEAEGNALDIARTLLDHGADPNAYFMAGDSRYTPLVGVIGEGEEDRPPHPQREALTRLLLERGAEPYDPQVVYNIHFHGRVLWYMELMYEFSLRAGRKADWDDPEWHMLDAGPYGSGARRHLEIAVRNNDPELAEWCLAHGASPNAAPPPDSRFSQRSLYEEAVLAGHEEVAELLARHGANRTAVIVQGENAFVAACLRLDRAEAERMLEGNPEHLRSRKAMLAAVRRDRPDVAALLLDLGLPIETEYAQRQRPLHLAAAHDAAGVAALLIERGAEIDPIESGWNNSPLDFAVWHEYPRMVELLSRHSSDVWNLVFTGNVQRLRDVLTAAPGLAKLSRQTTPLFWLPEDEQNAVEIVELFLAHGADAGFRSEQDGMTAADAARRRGLMEAAHRLAEAAGKPPDGPVSAEAAKYRRLADDMVTAYATGDAEAMHRINDHYGWTSSVEDLRSTVWRLVYRVRQAGGAADAFGIAQARELIARTSGFPSWTELEKATAKGESPAAAPYAIDLNKISLRRNLTGPEWDTLIDVMKERRVAELDANGLMTDDVLKRIAGLEHVTGLSLGGSRRLSDDGLRHLAGMPQLQHLDLSEYPGGKLTDRGLEVLRHLPNLRSFHMTWQRGISDAGVANLRFCEQIESVNLMGTPTGDGAIQALRGKPRLRRLDTGKLVTDAGVLMLHELPMFKSWHGGEPRGDLMEAADEPTHLLIDGPFTDRGLAALAGLEGLFALDLFWHVSGITPDAFAVLPDLPNLGHLGCDGKLSGDAAMRHIAAIPRLLRLRAQGTTATDDGFTALSRSSSLEYFWGRECPNLTGRGFAAFSKIPSLRGIGVSCKNVDDRALSELPNFPSLRELMPMDVRDDGFRHVGRCELLERLWCMYCRDTTDAATAHLGGLRLRTYYAGLTQITDRSLEILGRMHSLERVELYETKGVTDAGIAHLAVLPHLREISLSGLPNVTPEGARVFRADVRVDYRV